MRIIRVDEESDSRTMLWVAAGAAVGLVAGALIAERMSGRKVSGRTLWRRARGLSGAAVRQWNTLLGAAVTLKDAWEAREDDEPADAALAEPAADALEPYAAVGLGEDGEWDGDEEADDDALDDEDAIDARVLEAFANDPILAERAVEIEDDGDGRITLHGRVHTAREVAHAVTVARGVPGVSAVKQRLAVRDRR
jgi:hypothetical protein